MAADNRGKFVLLKDTGIALLIACGGTLMIGFVIMVCVHQDATRTEGEVASVRIEPGILADTVVVLFSDGSSATGTLNKGSRAPAPGEWAMIANDGMLRVRRR